MFHCHCHFKALRGMYPPSYAPSVESVLKPKNCRFSSMQRPTSQLEIGQDVMSTDNQSLQSSGENKNIGLNVSQSGQAGVFASLVDCRW